MSCGGGGGGSSSTTDAKLSVKLNFENARASDTGFYISNTEIGSVTLDYENSTGEGGSLDITSAASSGVVEVTNLVVDTVYTFEISAKGVDGAEVCSGSANINIDPDVVSEVNLVCQFEEVLAMENAVYDFVKYAMENASTLTAAQIDHFFASDFGIMDGMTRSQFIADMISENMFEFTDASITLTKVDVINPSSRAAGQETFIDFLLQRRFYYP